MFINKAKSWAKYFKIWEELDFAPVRKILEYQKSNNFASDRFWSYVDDIGENFKKKSAKYHT